MNKIQKTLLLVNSALIAYLCGYYFMLDSYTSLKAQDKKIRVRLDRAIQEESDYLSSKKSKTTLDEIEASSNNIKHHLEEILTFKDAETGRKYTSDELLDLLNIPIDSVINNKNKDGEVYYFDKRERSFEELKLYLDTKNDEISEFKNYLEKVIPQDEFHLFEYYLGYSSRLDESPRIFLSEDSWAARRILWFSYVGNNGLRNNHDEAWKYLKLLYKMNSISLRGSFPFYIYSFSPEASYYLRNIRVPPEGWESYISLDIQQYQKTFLKLHAFKYFNRDEFPGNLKFTSRYSPSEESFLYKLPGYSKLESRYLSSTSLLDKLFNRAFFQKYLRLIYINTFVIQDSAYKTMSKVDICNISRIDLKSMFMSDNAFINEFSLSFSNAIKDVEDFYELLLEAEMLEKIFYLKHIIYESGNIPEISEEMKSSKICSNIRWEYIVSDNRYIEISLSERPAWLKNIHVEDDMTYIVDKLWVLSAENN